MKSFSFGNWQVTASPECGGNLSEVYWQGNAVMRCFTDTANWESAPTNYGFAVLFPPNRIDDGKFSFEGKQYQLPVNEPERGNHLHGIALREKWQLTAWDENSLTMEFIFDENNSMYAGCPFKCKLSVRYIFAENSFEQHFGVENLSGKNMPCALGFHSAFAMPQKMRVHGADGRVELLPPRYLASGRVIPWSCGFTPGEWCDPSKVSEFGHFSASGKPLAEFEHGSFTVRYMPDEKFSWWMLWRKIDEFDYICAEPMNIKIGTFENAPEELPTVRPGETELFCSTVEII